jgi:uncharacterized RDD family membrane protein YckC
MPEEIFCSRCGQSMLADATFCQKCGAPVTPAATPTPTPPAIPVIPVVAVSQPYGGFWIRLLAYFIDRFIVGIIFSPVFIFTGIRLATQLHRMPHHNHEQLIPIFHFLRIVVPLAFIVQWLYEALLTSSSWQATVGKRVVGLKVTDEAGNRISFERATGRFFAKILSGLIFEIGFLMIAFTPRKQGLHDMIAGTLVMKT